MNTTTNARIFISYSHRGRGPEWKVKLLKALAVFERQHLLDVWEDGKIRVSAGWNDEITEAMSSASLVVFLLTPDALDPREPADPNYILKRELPFLRDRWERESIPVFPVVCEPCLWKEREESKWLHAIQSPAGAEALSGFSESIAERHLRALATAIAEELSRVAIAESSALPVPTSEFKTYLDKFPLTRGPGLREEKLIGREQELALLDLAFAQPHTAIVSLVAWGGVGKTMLVQHWLQRLQREGWFGARRVYAWSFYSQGTKEDRQASEDTFLAHALEWFGVQCEPTLSPWDKGRLLADAVARERTLLILDGIEPLQYPPGPMGGQLRAPGVQSLLKQLARKASSAKSENQNSKSEANCLCLVTTREPLTDLADFQRRECSPWGSVLRLDLGNLTAEAGAALLHHAGANRAGAAEIKPDDKELLAASREVDGHALTLNLLGRFLARAHGGDIRRHDLVKFEEADRKGQGGTTFKMLAAFENWFARSGEFGARQLAVLRILGLFDRPADAGCIAALRKPPVIPGLTDPLFVTRLESGSGVATAQPLSGEDWNIALSFLDDFGLVVSHLASHFPERVIDCHPLIREYFSRIAKKDFQESWHLAHDRLFEYLATAAYSQPESLVEMEPLYQSIYHACQAGFAEVAVSWVVWKRIRRERHQYSTRKLGAYSHDLAAISCFFSVPWTSLHEGLSPTWRNWVQNDAAVLLLAMGRLEEAVQVAKQAFQSCLTESGIEGAEYEAPIRANTLSCIYLGLGRLREAHQTAREAVALAERIDYRFERVIQWSLLGEICHMMGDWNEAEKYFRLAESLQARLQPEYPLLYLDGGAYLRSQLDLIEDSITDACPAVWHANPEWQWRLTIAIDRSLRMFQWRNPNDSIETVGRDHLSLGWARYLEAQCSAQQGNPSLVKEARGHLVEAADGIRRAGVLSKLSEVLLVRSRFHAWQGEIAEAQADLDEAWDIAERGPMRLHMADIHLYRARLFFREKHYPWKSAQDDLAAAEKLINECGYHRRDKELADAKRAILGA